MCLPNPPPISNRYCIEDFFGNAMDIGLRGLASRKVSQGRYQRKAYATTLTLNRQRADYSAQAKVATDGGNYVGEWVTKWGRHGRGEFTKPKLGTYKGCWLFDKQHGWGLLTYKVDRYEGFWVNGVKHGRGKELDREGREYEGYFVNNLKCGRGILRYPDGSVYDGDWVDGLKTGHGIQKYEDGAEYDGDWANGKKHGKGVFVYASGSKYEGGWVDGHEEGWGILTRTNGERYEGGNLTPPFSPKSFP